jgi:hypothetical protein
MTEHAPGPSTDKAPERHPGLPRWAKMLAIGAVVAVIVIVAVMLLAGGGHGPGMHG